MDEKVEGDPPSLLSFKTSPNFITGEGRMGGKEKEKIRLHLRQMGGGGK